MGGETQLSGPDLAQGITLAELPDGGQVVGHAAGEPVLLVRRGEEVFAVGASCTHYGGPLGDGLVVGDTVRCPWHHACFSLRTGEALRAPALNPVACYRVEREGDRVRVGGKLEPDRPARAAGGPESVVVVGAGAAGEAVARELRRLGYAGPVVLLAPEGEPPYDRPNISKDYLAGNAPEDWIPLHPPGWYAGERIELRTARAAALDPAARTLTLSDGSTLSYGALVLATGAEPVRLAIPGADLPHVQTLRSLGDSRALIARARPGGRAVVVGASFIGLEVAASLRARQVEVTVVAPDERPLARVMGPELGDLVRSLHEEHGVAFRLGTRPREIRAAEVELESGEVLPADLVVLGVGVRPNVALAQAAGLAVDNGVLVDELLETSAPGVWAAGDIARWPDPWTGERIRVEHWVVAQRQGQAVARNLLAAPGSREPFTAVPFFWSQHYDVPINYVGHAAGWDATEVAGSLPDRTVTVGFRKAGRLLAVASIYRDRENLEAELAMERGDRGALEEIARRKE